MISRAQIETNDRESANCIKTRRGEEKYSIAIRTVFLPQLTKQERSSVYFRFIKIFSDLTVKISIQQKTSLSRIRIETCYRSTKITRIRLIKFYSEQRFKE
jgi:hypothetical protein